MTIEAMKTRRENRADYLITCDGRGCQSAADAKDREFVQAIAMIKAKGWAVKKVYGTWQHICPVCLGGNA